jgi:F-type H+-transporting ATPase subunit b
MPQINQLALVAYSQWFWLLLVLALIYFGIGRAMLPKIQSTIDAREARIGDDLAAAERARAEADATEEAYRQQMDQSRGEAMKLTAAAKQDSARASERRAAEADAASQVKLGEAAARIRKASDKARADIEKIAAEMARDIVGKVAGITVDRDQAAAAVKVAVTHG